MLGVNDFIGYYDWTFHFLQRNFGQEALEKYWEEAIAKDALRPFFDAIADKGIVAMAEHWAYSAIGEECDCHICFSADYFRYDMHGCPSLGFVLKRGKCYYGDYCTHCMGWIKHVLANGGWKAWHEHNHRGQCWIEIRRKDDPGPPSEPGELAGQRDVRLRKDWPGGEHHYITPQE
ncbi:MAG: hypothetical protein GXY33_11175 [Phycisphaerae bacterium]|nr:hypothetical protein [Phycisphaerae bacterium]